MRNPLKSLDAIDKILGTETTLDEKATQKIRHILDKVGQLEEGEDDSMSPPEAHEPKRERLR